MVGVHFKGGPRHTSHLRCHKMNPKPYTLKVPSFVEAENFDEGLGFRFSTHTRKNKLHRFFKFESKFRMTISTIITSKTSSMISNPTTPPHKWESSEGHTFFRNSSPRNNLFFQNHNIPLSPSPQMILIKRITPLSWSTWPKSKGYMDHCGPIHDAPTTLEV
jgi:hypothetical protein